jgi:hypothetical protein
MHEFYFFTASKSFCTLRMVEFALHGKSICKECMYHEDHGKLGFVGVLIVIMVVVVVLV